MEGEHPAASTEAERVAHLKQASSQSNTSVKVFSMSDSSSIVATAPSHTALEEALRNAVRHVYKTGNLENLTVRRVRRAAEEHLDLGEDFFKDDPSWKEKSKTIIQNEVEAHADPSSQISPEKASSPELPTSKAKHHANGKRGAATGKVTKSKRRKSEDSDMDESVDNHERKRKKSLDVTTTKGSTTSPAVSDLSGEASENRSMPGEVAKALNGGGAKFSESEMSEVLDEAPKPKRKRKCSGPEKNVSKMKSKPSKATNVGQPADPDAEEIKRLQGWLVKCGIRKVWGKELKPYDTPKAKIRHLKDMLGEAGMTGRYSAEKATQIKEERELKADLEAVQAGNKSWGMDESKEDNEDRPKRRLAKGLKELDFLNDDGEETD